MTELRDAFDKARSIAAAGLVAAGAAAIIGTVLEWVTIDPPPNVPGGQAHRVDAFTGLETKSGPYIVIAAGCVILLAVMLVARRRSVYGWGAFLASMTIGGLAIQNYRGIDELFYDQMERIGDPSPALGLMLVAAAGMIGVIAGAAGVAASPREQLAD